MIEKNNLCFHDPWNDQYTIGRRQNTLTRFFELFEETRKGDNKPAMFDIADPTKPIKIQQLTIPCLSVKQPWAHFIFHGYKQYSIKDVENRTWLTHYRGPLLIHASQKFDCGNFNKNIRYQLNMNQSEYIKGGIVGIVNLVDCKFANNNDECLSEWHDKGYYGWKLEKPESLEFYPCKGRLNIFQQPIPEILLKDAGVGLEKYVVRREVKA